MSPSDESDIYSNVNTYSQGISESTNKHNDVKSGKKSHKGFQVFPQPTTPPEPAPPDHPTSRQLKETVLPSGSHTSLDEIKSDGTGSQESMATRDSGWVDESVFLQRQDVDEELWGTYRQHAFTTGRRHMPAHKSRPQGSSQTLKQPGKLNLQEFSLVTETIARMNLGGKDVNMSKHSKAGFGNAPLATPENVDLGSEYAQVIFFKYKTYVYIL
ncbi:unnamed protein product, partial [Timema podura]|nr:unnamed protein product [Timema podura]